MGFGFCFRRQNHPEGEAGSLRGYLFPFRVVDYAESVFLEIVENLNNSVFFRMAVGMDLQPREHDIPVYFHGKFCIRPRY